MAPIGGRVSVAAKLCIVPDRPPILTEAFDAFVLDHGWQLFRLEDRLALESSSDLFLFGAVPWSGWDLRASRALAAYTDQNPTINVVVFNIDDVPTLAHCSNASQVPR
jgi:hypothetical protein